MLISSLKYDKCAKHDNRQLKKSQLSTLLYCGEQILTFVSPSVNAKLSQEKTPDFI